MTDVVSQLEAVIAGIEERTPRECDKWCDAGGLGHTPGCDQRQVERVRSEIARTVERMVNAACDFYEDDERHLPYVSGGHLDEQAWAAAFRATQEQETQK